MTRGEFMDIVYSELYSDGDNYRANRIIDAADEYVETELQPCDDCISRKSVLELAKKGVLISNGSYESVCKAINELPPVTPSIKEWLSSFNTDSATECFTAVRELREKIKTN